MTVKLKKLLGDGGAGMDKSSGSLDTLYNLLEAVVVQLNTLTAQYNQLLTDHNDAEVPSTAEAVVSGVEVE